MRAFACALLVLALGPAGPVFAQEGFPLNGTWRGEWGRPGGEMTLAVVVMEWDGTSINGILNPGRNSVSIENATLDPGQWRVRIEASSREGEPIVIEGALENIGSYNRTVTGTWTQNGVDHPFQMTRE